MNRRRVRPWRASLASGHRLLYSCTISLSLLFLLARLLPPFFGSRYHSSALPSLTHVLRPRWLTCSISICPVEWKRGSLRRVVVVPVKCSPSGPSEDVESETGTASPSSSLSGNLATYKWCAGLGGIGFAETAYLSYLKLSDSDAFCPIGGGTCDDVLNSDYASVFGNQLDCLVWFSSI